MKNIIWAIIIAVMGVLMVWGFTEAGDWMTFLVGSANFIGIVYLIIKTRDK